MTKSNIWEIYFPNAQIAHSPPYYTGFLALSSAAWIFNALLGDIYEDAKYESSFIF